VHAATHRVFTVNGKLLAPRAVPARIAMLNEEPLAPETDSSAGVFGGISGGLLGGAFNTMSQVAENVPPPPVENPKELLRVGGKVLAPRPLYTPAPIYPVLARQARVEGDVVLDATLDSHGAVVDLSVTSGPQLLYTAALQTVRTWKYEPTYLNGEPVPVKMEVIVHFHIT
jgi:protein TonB